MRRLSAACALLCWAAGAVASPLDEEIPFPMEEGLHCSALLFFASNATKGGTLFDLPDPERDAAFGYAVGTGVLSYREKRRKDYVDKQIYARQPAVKAMKAADRNAATAKCVADFAAYQKG